MSTGLVYIGAESPLISYSPRPGEIKAGGATMYAQGAYTVDLQDLYFSKATLHWQSSSAFQISLGLDGTLDSGSSSTGATLEATYGKHDLRLQVGCAQCLSTRAFTLQGVILQTQLPGGNATLDDASSQITYSGFTSDSTSSSSLEAIRQGQFYQNTVSYTSSPDASLALSFVGTALYIFGPTGPSFGTFQIEIDATSKGTYNASTTENTYNTLLYFISGLQDGTHQFKMGYMGGGIVAFDYAVAVSTAGSGTLTTAGAGTADSGSGGSGGSTATAVFPNSSGGVGSGSSNGAAAGAIGGTLGILAAIVLGWIGWRYYQYRKAGGKEPFLAAMCGARHRPKPAAAPKAEAFKLWPMLSYKPKYAT